MVFYFDLYDGSEMHRDDYGDHLSCIDDARDMAAALVADIAHESKSKSKKKIFACEVRVRDGIVVARIEMTLNTMDVALQL